MCGFVVPWLRLASFYFILFFNSFSAQAGDDVVSLGIIILAFAFRETLIIDDFLSLLLHALAKSSVHAFT